MFEFDEYLHAGLGMNWAHAASLKLSVADGPGQDDLLGQTMVAVLVLKCSNRRYEISRREQVSLQHLLNKNSSSGNCVVNGVLPNPNNSTAYVSTEKHSLPLFNALNLLFCVLFYFFALHPLSSVADVDEFYNPSQSGMDHGMAHLPAEDLHCNFS